MHSSAGVEHAQAVVDVLEAHPVALVVEADLLERLVADQLQRGGDGAAASAERLGQVGGPVLEAVEPVAVQQREEDAGVLDQAVGVQQPRADDGGGAALGVRCARACARASRRSVNSMSALTRTASRSVCSASSRPTLTVAEKPEFSSLETRPMPSSSQAASRPATSSRSGLRVVDDEHLGVGGGGAERDEAAQEDVELVLAAQERGNDAERGTDRLTSRMFGMPADGL